VDDDLIVSWLAPAAVPVERSEATAARGCPGCGYAGELDQVGGCLVCPACAAEIPTAPGGRIVHCPECAWAIGVSPEDRGKTIICPRCQYFLGDVSRGGQGAR
jgi:hypothetical protein